ncbi:MAG: hypothetical protein ABII01_01240 [Candidatus Woesearchaeota archaeon]
MGNKHIMYILVFLVLISSVFALEATIGKPKMILYKNITVEGPLVFEQSVIVKNNNDYAVKIMLEPLDALAGRTEIYETNFELSPNDEKEAFYKITITQPGIYDGKIMVKFTKADDESTSAALEQRIAINVNGEGEFPGTTMPEPITISESEETTTTESEETTTTLIDGEVKRPNALIGLIIIIIIVLIGLAVYIIIITKIDKNKKKMNMGGIN